jgi:hypothetical protein
MAKPIVVSYQGAEAKFDHRRVDRAKLYGRRRRIPLDPEGKACQRADLSDDGSVLVSAGMTPSTALSGLRRSSKSKPPTCNRRTPPASRS